MFNEVIGIEKFKDSSVKINYRQAVRAIIMDGYKVLMVHTKSGDYKFPGGGVEKAESYEDALKREVLEETGYVINKIKDKVGTVIQRRLDIYEENSMFEMTSSYYLCEISNVKKEQKLDEYEAEQEFKPVWIEINEAIKENDIAMKQYDENDWIYRENLVLKKLSCYQ